MAVRFVKIASPDPVIDYVTQAIRAQLDAGRPVLWFISGGSCIAPETQIAHNLRTSHTANMDKLEISLTDERPGPVGHADSNAKQLHDVDFPIPFHAILDHGNPRSQARKFDQFLEQAFAKDPFCIGLLGIGPDGHTAGIPHAQAPASDELAAYYVVRDFSRVSMTPRAIARLDEAVVYAMGQAKLPALEMLTRDIPISEQSAQALKQSAHVVVFNDVKGECI